MPTTSAIVSIVAEIHSSRVGQVTRRSSAMTPRTKSPPAIDWAVLFCCSFTKGSLPCCHPERVEGWQGGQDSNLQQLVLETRTLPIELPPYLVSRCGLCERQKRQYLLELQPVGRLLTYFFACCSCGACIPCRPEPPSRASLSLPSVVYHNMNKTDRRSVPKLHASIPPSRHATASARREEAGGPFLADRLGSCARPESNWQPWA